MLVICEFRLHNREDEAGFNRLDVHLDYSECLEGVWGG